jgi:DNA/RNA endonuclease G, NUC1
MLKKSFIALSFFASMSAFANTQCPEFFVNGAEPLVSQANPIPLCFHEFAVAESVKYKTPIYSAEHLTYEQIEAGGHISRKDAFHAENRLPDVAKALPTDYKRSGYDRGHMTPSRDASSAQTQWETFSMANMIPQAPDNNRKIWAGIEAAVRNIATSEGEVYVVTGPIYNQNPKFLNNRIAVPGKIFKAVYIPKTQQAAAYLTNNNSSQDFAVISIAQLQTMTGFDPFPALPTQIKQQVSPLPDPQSMIPHFND